MRRAQDSDPDWPTTLLVSHGSEEGTLENLAKHWPEASVIFDPDRELYADFGLERAKVWSMLNMGMLGQAMEARRAGYRQTKVDGDAWQMPGAFLIRGNRILWRHRYRHVGDHPDWAKLPEVFAKLENSTP